MDKLRQRLFEKRNSMHHQYRVDPNLVEKSAAKTYLKDLEKVLKQKTRNKIRDLYINNVTKHEDELINDILGVMTNPLDIAHFFLGAHIRLEGDNVGFYKKWAEDFQGPRKNRISSHASIDQQYAVSGPVVTEALFGTSLIDPDNPSGAKCTWIQLENRAIGGLKEFKSAPVTFLINVILHMINYFDYKITKRNIGPHGKSNYTEDNPLRINVSYVTPELAVRRANLWKEIIFQRLGDITGLEDKMVLAGIDVPDGFKAIPSANV
jgi:hypothetical protein